MKTGIIILNYNTADDTVKYVNKIKNYSVLDKIIVVDNLSSENNCMEKLNKLKNDKIYVIRAEKNGGYSYGNNFGMKYLNDLKEEFDYIIISNPDIEVAEEAIKKCIEFLEKNKKAAVCAPKMVDSNQNPVRRSSWKIRKPLIDMINSTRLTEILFWWAVRKGEYSFEDYKKSELKVEAVSGAFFVIKYDVFEKCNFFDENTFLFYEEDILANKIKKLGYEEYSLNNISFTHYESQTIDKAYSYLKKIKMLQKSKMYYQKEYNNINIFQIAIFKILNLLRKIELIIEVPVRKVLKK